MGYIVYKHTSPSGKVYIGITRDAPQKRWKGGNGYANNNHFFRAIKKYGWPAFQHEILAEGLTEAEATRKEKELIAYYDSTNPSKGYNRDPGGGVRSKETAAKISAALTGVPLSQERRKRMSEQRKGRAMSEETKRLISERHKANPIVQANIARLNKERAGTPLTKEHRQKIAESQPRRQTVINLDTGVTFDSVKSAAKSCNGAHPNIVKACQGQRQKAYGYRWAYGKEA